MGQITEETARRLLEFADTANTIAELREQRNKYLEELSKESQRLRAANHKIEKLEALLCAMLNISRESLWESSNSSERDVATRLRYDTESARELIEEMSNYMKNARQGIDNLLSSLERD
jgi:ribosomal protein L22